MTETPKQRYVMILKDRGEFPGKRNNKPFTMELHSPTPKHWREYFEKFVAEFSPPEKPAADV